MWEVWDPWDGITTPELALFPLTNIREGMLSYLYLHLYLHPLLRTLRTFRTLRTLPSPSLEFF